jgi:DNA-binding NtrC family response regulator
MKTRNTNAAVSLKESRRPRILLADDDPDVLACLCDMFGDDAYEISTAENGLRAIELVQSGFLPDLVLMDVLMPQQDGITTLARLKEIDPGIKVVMLSGMTEIAMVVRSIKMGALDYLTKPFTSDTLHGVVSQYLGIGKSIVRQSFVSPSSSTSDEIDQSLSFLAASSAMQSLRRHAALVARVEIPVLILGESGTGKEVVARLIHKLSARSGRTFLKVNCAAMPDDLLESELFGHEAGAFTGAAFAKPGKFELCDKGTMLLDEIGEMHPRLQAKLLQVLQDGTFSRLGGRTSLQVDVRILAATNIDIPQALASKKLREDLYYRLNAFSLHVPPLRERIEEIPIFLQHYIERYAKLYACAPIQLSPTLLNACMRYAWPGNVRELCNFVKRALVLREEAAMIRSLDEHVQQGASAGASGTPAGLKSLVRDLKDNAESEAILAALQQTHWNRIKAAKLLGISYRSLLSKIQQYGLVANGQTEQ